MSWNTSLICDKGVQSSLFILTLRSMTTPRNPSPDRKSMMKQDNAAELPRLGLLVRRLCAPEGISPAERDLVPAVEIAIDLDSTTNVSSVQGPSEEQLNQELQSRELSSAEL